MQSLRSEDIYHWKSSCGKYWNFGSNPNQLYILWGVTSHEGKDYPKRRLASQGISSMTAGMGWSAAERWAPKPHQTTSLLPWASLGSPKIAASNFSWLPWQELATPTLRTIVYELTSEFEIWLFHHLINTSLYLFLFLLLFTHPYSFLLMLHHFLTAFVQEPACFVLTV